MTHPSGIGSRSNGRFRHLSAWARSFAVALAAVLGLRATAALSGASPEIQREFIYDSPPPTPECHASTVCETKGALTAAWFGGTREKAPDVGIWFSRREGSGPAAVWSPPVELFNGVGAGTKGTRLPCWNPVLQRSGDEALTLYYKVGPSPDTWWGMRAISSDGGRTWTAPERLPAPHLGPIKNKAVRTSDNFLLFPSSTENAGWRVQFERFSPSRNVWQYPDAVSDPANLQGIQPTVLTAANGELIALGRTRKAGAIFRTVSNDQGITWTPLATIGMPNPNSGIDAVTLADQRHVLVYNHTRSGRSPLNVAVSTGDATQWSAVHVLETQAGEYSYPAVIQTSDGLVHIVYTWHRTRIRQVVLDPKKFKPVPIVDGRWPAP